VMPVEWNKQTRRYEKGGKSIPPETVRRWVLETVEQAKANLKAIGEGFTTHRNTAEWVTASRSELRRMHTALAMVAQGGRSQMDVKAWGRVGNMIKSEANYLRQFERDLANGKVSDAQLLARVLAYGEGGYKVYQNMVKAREAEAGMFARRVLGASEKHCDDCLEAASPDFVPAHEVREIGDSQCGSLCHCDVEFAEAA
jgi:hypothetical protein